MSTETWHVCFLRHTGEGKASAKSLAEGAGEALPPGRGLDQDQGVQGCVQDGIMLCHPKKTPPGGELTPPEQATHRRSSAIRIRLEQAIGGVKRDRSVRDKIRLVQDGMRDAGMETCGGLPNFRLQYRPWQYA